MSINIILYSLHSYALTASWPFFGQIDQEAGVAKMVQRNLLIGRIIFDQKYTNRLISVLNNRMPGHQPSRCRIGPLAESTDQLDGLFELGHLDGFVQIRVNTMLTAFFTVTDGANSGKENNRNLLQVVMGSYPGG